MNGKKNTVPALALILILSLGAGLLAGCGNDAADPGDKDEGRISQGYKVKSPVKISYLVQNQLTVTETRVDRSGQALPEDYPSNFELDQMTAEARAAYGEDPYFYGTLIQIDGLANADVQEAVNGALLELFTTCVEKIPPYRGIKAALGETPQFPETENKESVNMWVSANFNNILSVTVNKNSTYKSAIAPGESVYVGHMDVKNFDLNTGEEIALTSLFCDDVDAMSRLNAQVAEALDDNLAEEEGWIEGRDSYLKITGPFKGLAADQKYCLNNGGINLVFDYATPQFDTGFGYGTLTIPFSEETAVTKRFFKEEENIYTAQEPWAKQLLRQGLTADVNYSDYQDGEIYIDVSGRWSSRLPEPVLDVLEELCEIDGAEIAAQMTPYRDQAVADYGEANVQAYYNKWVTAHVVGGAVGETLAGGFVNVTYNEDMRVFGNDWDRVRDSQNYLAKSSVKYQVYRVDTGEPMALEEVFRKGFDYEEGLKAALASAIRDAFIQRLSWEPEAAVYDFGNGETREQDLQYVDRLVGALEGFYIGDDSLYLNFNNREKEIFTEIYGASPDIYPDGGVYVNSVGSVPYAKLGCDNLTLFD